MKYLILISFLFFQNVEMNASQFSDYELFCQIQAEYVTQKCSEHETLDKKNCYIEKMQLQDFLLKKDFMIDSDGSIVCISLPDFKNL